MLVYLLAAMVANGQATAPSPSQPAPAAVAPSPCASPEHRQFDFWVGKWDVYPTGKDKLIAHSLIESVYGGCGVRENWMPLKGGGGGSLNMYIPEKKHWEQFWIDGQGTRGFFIGGWNGKAMVIKGEWGGPLVRISYSKNADGSVRQFGEQSTDRGHTWAPSFDLTYRPAQ